MDRSTRCETLAQVAPTHAQRLANLIMDGTLGDVLVVIPPTVGMLMARAIDGARGQTFNLGEVLVSEARVSIDGHEGWGMVMGNNGAHARAVAVVVAGPPAGHAAAAGVERELVRLAADLSHSDAADWQAVAPTRVHFENF
jgi:alpha-D-ribose 1-methylphosphonate 5-triphosphate synthase subunit PhnG